MITIAAKYSVCHAGDLAAAAEMMEPALEDALEVAETA